MKTNTPRPAIATHEGGTAKQINQYQQLRRSVMSCLLWEREFYEDGESITSRIAALVPMVAPEKVAEIAVEARDKMKLRHIPLFLAREMARHASHRKLVADLLATVIRRADEPAEFLAMYWKEGKCAVAAQVKKGLAKAFQKFDAYQLAKYNRDGAVKLRDALFVCHAKPKDAEQAATWKMLVEGTLPVPDTWEVALSSGADKKEAWGRLLAENKLGGLALLRNLRNMREAGVEASSVIPAITGMRTENILPFRFIAAARYAPQWENHIESIMLRCMDGRKKLPGKTVLLVDVSGSMDEKISAKSDLTRMDAACGLAMLAREVCEDVEIFSFSMAFRQIPARRGFALRDAIVGSQEHSGTPLGEAVAAVYVLGKIGSANFGQYGSRQIDYQGQGLSPDRLIIITDEQSGSRVPDPKGKGYMINVASAQNGVGYGAWTHIDGWSEAVLDYIIESEQANLS